MRLPVISTALLAVLVTPPPLSAQARITVSGQVVDATTRVPIRGALVRSAGPDSTAATETRGDGGTD
ncbi:MAG: hypothetical protein HUU26_15260, partial [Gemmatimonadaceae bacterium]|nr:hypothetical protein [Gemmatimonadaceae bacterium]